MKHTSGRRKGDASRVGDPHPDSMSWVNEGLAAVNAMTPEDCKRLVEHVEVLYALGRRFYVMGQDAEAFSVFQAALAAFPIQPECMKGCALALKRLERYDEALYYFNGLVLLRRMGKTADPVAFSAMAEIFLSQRDPERALRCLGLAEEDVCAVGEGRLTPVFDVEHLKGISERIKDLREAAEGLCKRGVVGRAGS